MSSRTRGNDLLLHAVKNSLGAGTHKAPELAS